MMFLESIFESGFSESSADRLLVRIAQGDRSHAESIHCLQRELVGLIYGQFSTLKFFENGISHFSQWRQAHLFTINYVIYSTDFIAVGNVALNWVFTRSPHVISFITMA